MSESSVVVDFEKLSKKQTPVHQHAKQRRGTFLGALKDGVSSINSFIKEHRVLEPQDAAAAGALASSPPLRGQLATNINIVLARPSACTAAVVVESARKQGQSSEFRTAAAAKAKAAAVTAGALEEGTIKEGEEEREDGEQGEQEGQGEQDSEGQDGENEHESDDEDDAVADGLRKTVRDRSKHVGLELVINCEGSRFLLKVGAGNQTVKWLALAV